MEFRAQHLAMHPLCEHCTKAGKVRLGTEVDHRIALHNGGADFDIDPGQAQTLCYLCHLIKTAADMGQRFAAQKRIGMDGFPVPGGCS